MSESVIYIPISRKLYNDIVRFSDGKLDPAAIAENQLETWIRSDLEHGLTEEDYWGDRFEEAASEFVPHLLEALAKNDQELTNKKSEDRKPLVWKEVSISAGSEVRMSYGGQHHYAKVRGGNIVEDDDGTKYSPSEWASKVADGTSRNAWCDLWFREPLSKTWVPAQLLRDQAQQEAHGRAKSAGSDEIGQ